VVIVLGIIVLGVSLSPIFAADRVVVRGVHHLSAEQVRGVSGLSVGTNVLYAGLEPAMARLEANGWVAEATAHRALPATIVIDVRERVPVGRVTIEGRSAVVMADGTVLVGTWVRGLPWLIVTIGSGSSPSLTPAAAALGAMPGAVLERVSTVTIGPDGSLVMQLQRGIVVTYGPPIELEDKGRALAELLVWADQLGARVTALDVTVPQAPTARLPNGSSPTL
jgi:cell division protein FtsQ